MFAVRQVTNRDIGFSPHEIVFGQRMKGPLDILYSSWAEDTYQNEEVTSWVQSLQDRLLTLHEYAHSIAEDCARRRLAAFNQGKSSRELSVDDQVLLRVPGMHGVLEASWEGPYKVKEKLSKVNYRITD